MKQFLKQHLQQSLAASALIFFGIIAVYVIWGIGIISFAISKVTISSPQASLPASFNIRGAQSLDLKGLSPQ